MNIFGILLPITFAFLIEGCGDRRRHREALWVGTISEGGWCVSAHLIEGCAARRRHREALWVGMISEGGWCASAHLLVAKTWLIKRERLCQTNVLALVCLHQARLGRPPRGDVQPTGLLRF